MGHAGGCAGLEFEFGDADGVFDEEDLLGASGEEYEGAVFILVGALIGVFMGIFIGIFIGVFISVLIGNPGRGGVAEGFVLKNFDGDVAEGLIAQVAGDVGEGGGREAGFGVLELEGCGRLVFEGVN